MSSQTKITFLTALATLTPLMAFAQPRDICGLLGTAFTVVTYFGTVVLLVAVAALLYAGFLFLTGGGNPETVTKAKNVLVWALVGLAVALLAIYAAPIVRSVIGGDFLSGCPGVMRGF